MTARYRESELFNGLNGGFFGKKAVLDLLEQADCVGIRYYYGVNGSNDPVLVLVGATAENTDITEGKVLELSVPCPSVCDASSPLTGN